MTRPQAITRAARRLASRARAAVLHATALINRHIWITAPGILAAELLGLACDPDYRASNWPFRAACALFLAVIPACAQWAHAGEPAPAWLTRLAARTTRKGNQ